MSDASASTALRRQVFVGTGQEIYAVLDGASVPDLPSRLAAHPLQSACLITGPLDPDLAQAAPYVARLSADDRGLSDAVLERGWGGHWGILAQVPDTVPFREVRRHFRDLLRVRDPDGRPVIFRYYDPRVLRVFMPTCTRAEAAQVMGPVRSYLLEDEDPSRMLRLRLGRQGTVREVVALGPHPG
jgi:hypothetical protein